MLIWQIKRSYLQQNLETLGLESLQTIYTGEGFQHQSIVDALKTDLFLRIWVVFEKGQIIGLLAFDQVIVPDCWGAYDRPFYLGVKKQRALLELYCLLDKNEPILKKEQWSEIQPFVENHIKIEVFDQASGYVKLQPKKISRRTKIRHAFYRENRYLSSTPDCIFANFKSWSISELEPAIPSIVSNYYQMQLERFALLGEAWHLKVQRFKYDVIEDTDEAREALKQEWITKGYQTKDTSADNYISFSFYWAEGIPEGKIRCRVIYSIYPKLDHKYNDGRIAYYRHVLKRHIMDYYMKDGLVYSVELFAVDGSILWSYVFDRTQKDYGDLICKHGAGILKGFVNRKERDQAIRSLIRQVCLKTVGTPEGFNAIEMQNLNQYMVDALLKIATHTSIEVSEKVFYQTFEPLLSEYLQLDPTVDKSRRRRVWQDIHDRALIYEFFFYYKHQIFRYVTPSVLKQWMTELSHSRLQVVTEQLRLIQRLDLAQEKEVRKWLYQQTRKHGVDQLEEVLKTYYQSLSELKESELQQKELRFMKRSLKAMNVSKIETVQQYLAEMRRYDEKLTFKEVIDVLGLQTFGQMINGTYECVFHSQDFIPSYQPFGQYLITLLRGSVLANPKRLYHQLRQIKSVDEIIQGDLTEEEATQVLKLLSAFQQDAKPWEPLFKLSAKVEQKGSPEFLMAGNASVCCMRFGANNALTYAKEKAFGILNFYYENRVVGNSVLWIHQSGNERFLVLDNIEIHPNYDRIKPFLKDFLMDIVHQLQVTYDCQYVVQGESYNDFKLYTNESLDGTFTEKNPVGYKQAESQSPNFYTDAHYFKLICGEEYLEDQPSSSKEPMNRYLYVGQQIELTEKSRTNRVRLNPPVMPQPVEWEDDLPF